MIHPIHQPETQVNINSFWGALTAEVLYRLGLRQVVISPGSRSTPLTVAFARHPGIEAIPVLDERSASFFALGIARISRNPVALVCTSGTAAANYYPAVIEAAEGEVPLLVLSADRPVEMRHCQSGQAIDQVKLYGTYPAFQTEIAIPEDDSRLFHYLGQTLVHSWERCLYPVSGPVHLNFPFRDPLPPIAGISPDPLSISQKTIASLINGIQPISTTRPMLTEDALKRLFACWREDRKGLIIVGPVQPENDALFADSVGNLAQHLGWPVLADSLSPVRNHQSLVPGLVCHYDVLLRNESIRESLKPNRVINIGALPVSKVLRKWLKEIDVPTWLLDPGVSNKDGLHRMTHFVRTEVEALVTDLPNNLQNNSLSEYQNKWVKPDQQIKDNLVEAFSSCPESFEGKIPWLLSRNLEAETPIFVASSMPVRDMETFWQRNDSHYRIFFNRGANGIDGTLSTAMGMAHLAGKRSVLITGDLAFLHDTNGLLNAKQLNVPLDVILINNKGGGIFDNLPIAELNPDFEKYFITPQAVSLDKLADAYGVGYELISDLGKLDHLLKGNLGASGMRILEVMTDRKFNVMFRRQIIRYAAKI